MTLRVTGDFASAAMVRVLVRGMVAAHLRPPVLDADLRNATVPLQLKRAVVEAAVEQGGFACLPLLGRGVHDLAHEPTHLALTLGRSAGALWSRWQRLERYVHSRHRVLVEDPGGGRAQAWHVHKDGGPAPSAAESLVVCGLLCALLEANGLRQVCASADGAALYPAPDPEAVDERVRTGRAGRWQLSWQPEQPAGPAAVPAVAWADMAPPLWSPLACRVAGLVARHLPEVLPLDAAASALPMARRSLQRALAAEGLAYQQVQAEVRFRLTGWHLLRQGLSVAETGFVCGYADQAHLTREFRRRVGVAPARYRSLFVPDGPR